MSKLSIDEYRNQIDNDEGLTAKRKALVITSLLLLSLCVSGAEIKDANTFILTMEFSNHSRLIFLIGAAVAILMIRYYAYAQQYHCQLSQFWAARLMSDYRVFWYNHRHEEVEGLLGCAVDIWGGDEPGLPEAQYKKVGIFKRNLVYTRYGVDNDDGGVYSYTENIELNSYSGKWTKKHFCKLLKFEFIYRLEGVIKHREYLDLILPYLIGTCALSSLFYNILIATGGPTDILSTTHPEFHLTHTALTSALSMTEDFEIMLATFTGLLGVLIGVILGHRLSIGREKRKEFNDVALPIFENLERQKSLAKRGAHPDPSGAFGEDDFILLKQHLGLFKAKTLDSAIKKYEHEKKKCGNWNTHGIYEFTNGDNIIAAIGKLQRYVRRK